MKRVLLLVLAVAMSFSVPALAASDTGSGQGGSVPASDVPASPKDFSYALGMNIANSLQQLHTKIDVDQLTQAIRDELGGKKTRLSKQAADKILQTTAQKMQAEKMAEFKKQAAENLKKSKAFMAKAANKPGVKTTKDGLVYKVLKQGNGPSPAKNDKVVVDYKGMLADGTVFDSTYKRGKPATLPVNAVIPGWSEALQMMHVGGKYKLYIPPHLAYGEQGAGQVIGPNEALVFEVALHSIKHGSSGQGQAQGGNNGAGANGGSASN